MNILIYIVVSVAYILIIVEQLCMFLRAILSWFIPDGDNVLLNFLYYFTEPVIAPVRLLLRRLFPALDEFPIDIAFSVTLILLLIIEMMLPTVYL